MTVPFALAPPTHSYQPDPAIGRTVKVYYIDVNGSYSTTNPGDLLIIDPDAVDEDITNVLLTPIGSEEFEPTFGSEIPNLLFEPMGIDTARRVKVECRTALKKWLGTRLAWFDVQIVPDNDAGNYFISIPYKPVYSGKQLLYSAVFKQRGSR